jgi:L-iditol 2-dehydrogenase
VVGCGAIGLFALQWARLQGATFVHAIDVDDSKHAIATELGADLATHPDATDHLDRYDVVLEAAGFPNSINLASRLAGPGGEVVFIGIPTTDVPLDRATFDHLLRHEITWHGAWNSFGDPFPGASWFETVEAFENNQLQWQPVVTHDLDLAELPGTFDQIRDRQLSYAKILFRP